MRDIANFIAGSWRESRGPLGIEVIDPATGDRLGQSPEGTREDVDAAVAAASDAFIPWSRTPPEDRIQYLFRFKQLLEDHFEEVARLVSIENGKTLAESRGELRRGIENVEVACGIPLMMQGYCLEDVARGIDESMFRQPLGVVAIITPFNFPVMIPLWFLPYAIACGNTVVLKPSDRVPFSMLRVAELLEKTGLPPGVFNLVNGGKAAVDAILDHPAIEAVSFVGSSPVARYIDSRAAANGKRVQCQGGAKNHVAILPDADPVTTTQIVADSAFGCAGQRCLALSVAIAVGDAQSWFKKSITNTAEAMRVGRGVDDGTQMGPVISQASRERIRSLIGRGTADGAVALVDGRDTEVSSCEQGSFVGPTVLDGVRGDSELTDTEIFGPVLSVVHAADIDEAVDLISRSRTATRRRSSPRAARRRASSATVSPPATSGSISALRRRWPTSRSAAGRAVSWATSMRRGATRSSSTPTRRSSSNAGPTSGHASSRPATPEQQLE